MSSIAYSIKLAADKLFFCLRASSGLSTFAKLVVNTKRYRTFEKQADVPVPSDPPVPYSLKLQGIARTIALRTFAGDIAIFYDVWWRNVYTLPARIMTEARVIVDLGAHTGMTSLYFHTLAPDAHLYAVEADAANMALLNNNLHTGIEAGKITTLHAAIYEQNGPLFIEKAARSYNSRISTAATGFAVEGMTLPRLLHLWQLTHIDILKIDIEGAERFLLQDPASWMQRSSHILIELHSEALIAQFNTIASQFGFTVVQQPYAFESIFYAYR